MRLSGLLFALCLGFGLPALLFSAGVELPEARWAALAVAAFAVGYAVPAGLDYLTQDDRAEAESLRAQRDALTRQTLVYAAEREAKLNEPAILAPAPDYQQSWRVAFHRFVTAGNLYGFKVRDLGAGPHKVVEWEDWAVFREPLIDMGVLEARGGTRWAADWDYAKWQKEGAALPLPYFQEPPPPVALSVNSAQNNSKQQVMAN